MRKYRGNYPREQIGLIADSLIGAAFTSIIFVLPAAIGVCACLYNLFDGGSYWLLLHAALCLLIFLWIGLGVINDIRRMHESRVMALYSARLGDTQTFLAGAAISRNMRQLDELADRLGVRAIYDFGLEKYLAKTGVEWHKAEVVLKTFTTLLDHLKSHPGELPDQPAIVDDLEKMAYSFNLAAEKGIAVCFHFTNSHVYSGPIQEHLLPHSHF